MLSFQSFLNLVNCHCCVLLLFAMFNVNLHCTEPVFFNFLVERSPKKIFQRLKEPLCIYLNLIYVNQALNCKLAEPRSKTTFLNYCVIGQLICVPESSCLSWSGRNNFTVASGYHTTLCTQKTAEVTNIQVNVLAINTGN